jgi:serine phosphatase RsbU (regulator of sigma subunit)
VMHQTLREMPGPRAEMTAVVSRWDPATHRLDVANCGHIPPVIVRDDSSVEELTIPPTHGLGGRASAKPVERSLTLNPGDRMIMVSDGVSRCGEGNAELGVDALVHAALRSRQASAADTVREIHKLVLAETRGHLTDDATCVCLSVG